MQSDAWSALSPMKNNTVAPRSLAIRAAVNPADPPPITAIVLELLIGMLLLSYRWTFIGVGLAATTVVTVWMTKIARDALKKTVAVK